MTEIKKMSSIAVTENESVIAGNLNNLKVLISLRQLSGMTYQSVKSFGIMPDLLSSIPAVCKPLVHPMYPKRHHTQCPKSHSSTPPLDLQVLLYHQQA